MIINQFALTFSDMGVSKALIHYQDSTRKALSSIYWFNVIIGFLIFIILILITPFISVLVNQFELRIFIPFAAINFLILPFNQQFMIILQRDLFFKKLSIVEIITSISAISLTISLAYLNMGVSSYLYGQLFNEILKTVLILPMGMKIWKPLFHFSFYDIKKYISFGSFQMGDKFLNSLTLNLDKIVIGTVLGTDALGYWKFSYDLSLDVYQTINPIFNFTAFPIFAKIKNNHELLKKSYFELIRFISFITFPAYLILIQTSDLIIPILFGNQWLPAIILFKILCVAGLVRSLINPLSSLYLAKGYANKIFFWNILSLSTQIPFIIFAVIINDIVFFASMNLIFHLVIFYLSYFYYIHNLFGKCFFYYIKNFILNLGIAIIVSIILMISSFIFTPFDRFILLALQITFSFVIYVGLQLIFQRKIISNLTLLIKQKKNLND